MSKIITKILIPKMMSKNDAKKWCQKMMPKYDVENNVKKICQTYWCQK